MENNAEIARKLGFTTPAILHRKKDNFFKNRPFLEAWYELESRYLKARSRCMDIALELKEVRCSQKHFSFLLYENGFFESVESAKNFLSCKIFNNACEKMPSPKHVIKLENIVKLYEEWNKYELTT